MEMRRQIIAVLGVALLILPLWGCYEQKGRERGLVMSDITSIEYWSNSASETLPLSLRLDSDQGATLTVSASNEACASGKVGIFSSVCPGPLFEKLVSQLSSNAFSSVANPSSLVPGEVVRKFTLRMKASQEMTKYVGEKVPAPEAFRVAEGIVTEIEQETIRHPRNALAALSLQFSQQSDDSAGRRFFFVVQNCGSESVKVPYPLNVETDETTFELGAVRSDVPLEKLGSTSQAFWKMEQTNIVDVKAVNRESGFITLAPGDSAVFEFAAHLEGLSGLCKLEFRYTSTLFNLSNQPLTRFEIVLGKSGVLLQK
jgi:hypothetical protein